MYKVLISDNVAQECVDILNAAEGIEAVKNTGLSPEELVAAIGEYDGLIVRSATKVREEVIAAAKKLKVIGRAGAGVDNIDVSRATDAGVVVVNTPGGNTVSTAEHAFSLIMALSRNIPQGDRSIKEGRWDRKKYMGVELRGKTLGIIGLGNIGRTLAKRAVAFEMKVLGVDPFITKDLAEKYGIEIAALDDIWANADYISVHTPLNDATRHMINAKTLAKCRDGVRIINCARGGIVKEDDLLAAIESGKVAGAALDVYETEPPGDSKLVKHEKVVCTPHLGASTAEAQDIVAVMVAEQVRDFLVKGEVRNAVNMPAIAPDVFERIKPYIDLCSRMGSLLGQMGEGQLSSVEITYYGDVHAGETWPITSAALEGVLKHGYAEGINQINAKNAAEKLGIKVTEAKSSEEMDYKTCVRISLSTDRGEYSTLGTIFGKNDQRVVNFMGFEIDFAPEGNMIVCGNIDRPGLIGDIGTVLGKRNVNIAHMTWARKSPAGEALVVFNTDEPVNDETLATLGQIKDIKWTTTVML